jgi:phosphatidylserine decarboxylase
MHITNKISRIFHKIASKEFPFFIQNIINNGYVNILGLDMKEFNSPSCYKSLNTLFTRKLVVRRDIEQSLDTFISPADSLVSALGEIDDDLALQIKGMSYNINELFTSYIDDKNINKLYNGNYMNFYLSPKDYHRYHSPYNAKVLKLVHIPGKLYPVNFKYLKKQESLFVENERVILECITKTNKLFYMVFVGALNVGQMVFEFETRVQTNTQNNDIIVYKYDDLEIYKGDCLGYFKMGSTVLLFWEKDMVNLEDLSMQSVKFTQTVAKIK